MVNLSKLSEALKELMAERGLNQSELAKAIGTCSSKLSSYITEQRAPNYQTFISLIEFFHCSADFLLGLKEYPCEDIAYKPVPPFGERLRALLQENNTSQYAFIKNRAFHGVFSITGSQEKLPLLLTISSASPHFLTALSICSSEE